MKRIVDRAADFVLAVERVFGVPPRVLDGSRAVQIDDVRLSLEAGERELCLIRMHGLLEEYLAIFEVPDYRQLAFRFGANMAACVIKNGRVLVERKTNELRGD